MHKAAPVPQQSPQLIAATTLQGYAATGRGLPSHGSGVTFAQDLQHDPTTMRRVFCPEQSRKRFYTGWKQCSPFVNTRLKRDWGLDGHTPCENVNTVVGLKNCAQVTFWNQKRWKPEKDAYRYGAWCWYCLVLHSKPTSHWALAPVVARTPRLWPSSQNQ